MTKEQRWRDGYTIANCTKQMTSKESTETAIRELVEYHVEKALKEAANTIYDRTNQDIFVSKEFSFSLHKDDVLNAYPLTLIK